MRKGCDGWLSAGLYDPVGVGDRSQIIRMHGEATLTSVGRCHFEGGPLISCAQILKTSWVTNVSLGYAYHRFVVVVESGCTDQGLMSVCYVLCAVIIARTNSGHRVLMSMPRLHEMSK